MSLINVRDGFSQDDQVVGLYGTDLEAKVWSLHVRVSNYGRPMIG